MSGKFKAVGSYVSLAGLQFGAWTVLNDGKVVNKNRKVLARCQCGKEKEIYFQTILRGQSISCGCKFKEDSIARAKKIPRITYEEGTAAKNALFSMYRNLAIKRNLVWEISKEHFLLLTKQTCYYCGIEPYRHKKTQYKTGTYVYNGVDRLNNKTGYTYENSVTCCKTCNIAKNDLTEDDFKNWIKRLISVYGKNL